MTQRLFVLTDFMALARVAGAKGQGAAAAVRAARLLGVVETLHETLNIRMCPVVRREYERDLATACAELDEATFTAARAEGQAMALEQAIAYALEEPDG